jgi:hypothetical protein
MSANSSQIGHTPSETLLQSNQNKSNIDQLLPEEMIITSQSLIPFTTTNMIPSQTPGIYNVAEPDIILTRRQLARRRQRQRRRQRKREQREERRLQQRQQRQQQEQQRLPRRHTRQQRYERRQERLRQRQQERGTQPKPQPEHFNHILQYRTSFPRHMNEFEIQLELAYTAYRKEQDKWDQEQIWQIEGFAVLEQLASLQEEVEQLKQIDAAQKIIEEDQQQRIQEELIQLEQWEIDAFLAQQSNEN